MTGRLILSPAAAADRPTWLAARRQGVTASEIAAVLGISPFTSAFNLYWLKRGVVDESYDDERLSLGRYLEPWIAERFAAEHAEFTVQAPGGLWASRERSWQLATPDAVLYDAECRCGAVGDVVCSCVPEIEPVGVAEFKTSETYDEWGEDGTDDVPAYIAAQVRQQIDVLDVPVGYVRCFFLHTQKTREYVIRPDADDVALIRARGLAFWQRVQAGRPPALDGHRSTTAALKALHPDVDADERATVPKTVAAEYRAAKRAQERAKARVAAAENKLRRYLGGAKTAVDPDGRRVCTRSVYPRKPYTVGAAVVDRLNLSPIKGENAA